MELLLTTGIGVVMACGVYLLLRGRTFSVVLGLSLMGYAVNLFLVGLGRIKTGAPPVIAEGAQVFADPLPQALVLTAIVIGFGMTAFIGELALRAYCDAQSDHVDGKEPSPLDSGSGEQRP